MITLTKNFKAKYIQNPILEVQNKTILYFQAHHEQIIQVILK
jgi:hypothetical protein